MAKGQIVIPAWIRKELGLSEGDRLFIERKREEENAKKYYDNGAYDKASEEYLKCNKYCELLVKKTEDETKKKEYYDAFEKFVEAASKLKRMKAAGITVEGDGRDIKRF